MSGIFFSKTFSTPYTNSLRCDRRLDGIITLSNPVKRPPFRTVQKLYTNSVQRLWEIRVVDKCMEPNMPEGSHFIFKELMFTGGAFDPDLPDRSSVVLFWQPEQLLPEIKRMVAHPGDIFMISEGNMVLNGKSINEHYLKGHLSGINYPPTVVPDKHVVVLPDNRGLYQDIFREFQPLRVNFLLGEVVKITGSYH